MHTRREAEEKDKARLYSACTHSPKTAELFNIVLNLEAFLKKTGNNS